MTNESRDGKEHFEKFDMAVYAKKMFGMYGGTEVIVKMKCNNNLVGVILDRFGKEISIIPIDNEQFTINIDVEISRQFLAWVIGLGCGAKVLGPESVVELMREEGRRVLEQYQ